MVQKLVKENKVDDKIKKRGRKGIPDSMRGIAWPIITKSSKIIPTDYKGDKD